MRVKENVRMRIETVKVSIIHDYIISWRIPRFRPQVIGRETK